MKKIKLLSPEEIIKKIGAKISKDNRFIFLYTIIAGFIANIIVITNNILFTDAIVFTEVYISAEWDITLGRWLLRYINLVKYGVVSSVVSTIFALVFIAISVLLICDLFKIKNKSSKILISSLLVVSPCFSETLFSVFCSAEYSLAFLLASLSVFTVYKMHNKYWAIILGAVALACSLGLYQPYIGVTCGLCVLVPLAHLLANNTRPMDELKFIIRSLLMGILGILLYEIIVHIVLNCWNLTMASYSGANEIGIKTILEIPYHLKDALVSFYKYFFTNGIINNLIYNRHKLNVVFFLILAISMILLFIKCKYKNNILFYIEIIMCTALIPIAFGIMEIIATERDINQLMCAPYILIFIMSFAIIERLGSDFNFGKIVCWILLFINIITVNSYFVMANASAMSARINTEKVYQAATRIIERIESNEEYEIGMPIMFVGNPVEPYFSKTNKVYEYASGNTPNSPLGWAGSDNTNKAWHNFIHYYLGINLNMVSLEQYDEIIVTDEFKDMKTFPSKDCIKVIDGVMVIKILENA